MSASAPIVEPVLLDFPLDELFKLELRIARRADELARLGERDAGHDYWETAEREVLPDALRLSA